MTDATQDPKPRLSKALRYEILRRDNHTCRYCGATPPDAKLTVDHVTPVALGGTNDPGNLVAACAACNAGKSSTPPGAPLIEDVKQSELRWKRAALVAAAEMSKRTDSRFRYVQAFEQAWHIHDWGDRKQYSNPLPENWLSSVLRLHDDGLPVGAMIECTLVAGMNGNLEMENVFRYFMGCANRRVAEMHEVARRLLEAEDGLS